jgi:hypothetical protein
MIGPRQNPRDDLAGFYHVVTHTNEYNDTS